MLVKVATLSATQHLLRFGVFELNLDTEELRKCGFMITNLTEPHPSPEQVQADSWWRKGFTRPLFMLLVAQLCDKRSSEWKP